MEVSDCPGGICPVPWATDTSGDDELIKPKSQWDTYIEKHREVEKELTQDNVNHPSHYTNTGDIECIEAIEAQLTEEEYRGFLRGNCAKYLWRCNNKGKRKEDLEKCQWYLNRLLMLEND